MSWFLRFYGGLAVLVHYLTTLEQLLFSLEFLALLETIIPSLGTNISKSVTVNEYHSFLRAAF